MDLRKNKEPDKKYLGTLGVIFSPLMRGFFIFRFGIALKNKVSFQNKLTTGRGCGRISADIFLEDLTMKHIVTVKTRNLCASAKNGGCGECQTSCQSACKTSCGIANQACEKKNK